MLDVHYLTLPECAERTVRYARFKQFQSNSFYLHFTGEPGCISDFLVANGLEDEETFAQRGLPNRPGRGEEFGWPDDPNKEYVALDAILRSEGSSKLVMVEISIDYTSNPANLYLWAGIP
jgi:hypothetical protein